VAAKPALDDIRRRKDRVAKAERDGSEKGEDQPKAQATILKESG
jgi:hypothetical protein